MVVCIQYPLVPRAASISRGGAWEVVRASGARTGLLRRVIGSTPVASSSGTGPTLLILLLFGNKIFVAPRSVWNRTSASV